MIIKGRNYFNHSCKNPHKPEKLVYKNQAPKMEEE
jgi:hypothetical protein